MNYVVVQWVSKHSDQPKRSRAVTADFLARGARTQRSRIRDIETIDADLRLVTSR